ncbi:VOC family protein [Dokdonella koreensis]|uniref:Glyoxalase/bleomycin resistance protein/dioxygenase n=1 Tax=Dokdonella koreensis DS-123 TaxID=1300342 RepID=A0A160DU39_9GAMM|nr:VOC family protein [Dokdonella koreensis]ANB17939.1 glyoxalase/bleomycin resistance protein/dioxygenase [Dokdonella koreensis DS-123]
MLDHVGFSVSDFTRSLAFYQRALAPLGIGLVMQVDAAQTGAGNHAGFGQAGKPYFWIGDGADATRGPVHVAFATTDRAAVDAFHRAALAAGGVDNGAPGLRPHYHPHYYGAFVLDPDGHNVEAVCHAAE